MGICIYTLCPILAREGVSMFELVSELSPSKSINPLPNNLPLQLTSFVGREREIREIGDLLTTDGRPQTAIREFVVRHPPSAVRLLTLLGAGGSGKTRLALQFAEQVSVADDALDYADGVWFVELAALSDASLIPNQFAAAFGLTLLAEQPALAALIRFLRDKELLIVLDNCEHLIDDCARVCDALLRACPDLKILATSRIALNIQGEVSVQVPPLQIVDAAMPLTLAQLEKSEAAQLFLARVQHAQPHFQLAAHHAPAIAQICARLDGIPLALELTAARVKALSLEQIAARLDDMFGLLDRGSRVALPRHQTLRAAMDWSHDLLSDAERVLFRRLAVFAGGWTLEAAEAVGSDQWSVDSHQLSVVSNQSLNTDPLNTDLLQTDILDTLAALVDKSLVIAEVQEGAARYRMLEPIRQYALEKLRDAGKENEMRARHVDFFLQLAEEAELHLMSPRRKVWLSRLNADHANLLAALEWAFENQPHAALRLAGAMRWFWSFGNYFAEGHQWLERVLAHKLARARTAERGKALLGLGVMDMSVPTASTALYLAECVMLWREVGDKQHLAHALFHLGYNHYQQGSFVGNSHLFEESTALARQLGDKWFLAFVLTYFGIAKFMTQNDVAGARALMQESLALWRELGDAWGSAMPLMHLGRIATHEGDYSAARSFQNEALTQRKNDTDHSDIAISLWDLSAVARLEGDLSQAKAWANEALYIFQRFGVLWGVCQSNFELSDIARQEKNYQQALTYLRQGVKIVKQLPPYRAWTDWAVWKSTAIAEVLQENVQAARLLGALSNLAVCRRGITD